MNDKRDETKGSHPGEHPAEHPGEKAHKPEKQQDHPDPEEAGKHTPSSAAGWSSTGPSGASGVPPMREKGATDVTGAPGTRDVKDAWSLEDEPSYWAGQRAARTAIAREDCPFGADDAQQEYWLKGWDAIQEG
jgi:ribosome modulation factor